MLRSRLPGLPRRPTERSHDAAAQLVRVVERVEERSDGEQRDERARHDDDGHEHDEEKLQDRQGGPKYSKRGRALASERRAIALRSASVPEPQRSSLTVLGGPLNGKRVVVDDVDEILIGSDPDCKLCIDLPGVSPIHARFWRDLAGAKVYDTRSASGLYVNDDAITAEAPVRDGDVLWLGEPGSPDSVMIQVRLGAPATSALGTPPFQAGEPGEFFVEEAAPAGPDADLPPISVAASEDFVFEPETPGGPPPAAETFAAPSPVVAADEEVILFNELPPPAPASVAPSDHEFLIEVVEPAAPAPSLPKAPPVVTAPPPPPAPPVAPPPAAAPPPIAAKPLAPAPRPSAPPKAAGPAAVPPPADVFVVDDAAVKAARPVALTPKPAPGPRPFVPPPAPPSRPRVVAAPRPMRRKSGAGRGFLLASIGVLVVMGAGGYYAAMHFVSAPDVAGIAPVRARVGDAVTITGKNFSANAAENEVMFSGKPGRVVAASTTQLKVELPALTTTAGRDVSVDVAVSVKGRSAKPGKLAVFQAPRLHAISPDIGMPGDVVALAGTAWGGSPKVLFDAAPAEVVEVSAASIKVRVPTLDAAPGADVKVVVATEADSSNALAFVVGRLPLVRTVAPPSANPGDVVTISGRGLYQGGAGNVRIGGVRGLVVGAAADVLKVSVPFLSAGGAQPVEVRVPGSEHVGQATLTVSGPSESIELRFAAEPAGDDANHAAVSTALGPALLLATANGKPAAERALEAAQRMNEAVSAIRASRDMDFEARGFDSKPVLALAGKDEALVEATSADAALYGQRGGGKTPVSAARLAVWWEAVTRDLVLLLARGEKPQRVAALSAADGRALADVYAAAQKTGGPGVSPAVLAAAKPPLLAALRSFAVRVPASVPTPASAKGVAAAAVDQGGGLALPVDRAWTGFEVVEGIRKFATVTFKGNGGSYNYSGGVAVSLPLSGVEQKRGELRFILQTGGRSRHYLGRWDGTRISGRISGDASGSGDLGTFELTPR